MPEGLRRNISTALNDTASRLRIPEAMNEIPNRMNELINQNTSNSGFSIPSPQSTEIRELTENIANSMNTANMEALLASVLQELKMINGNTATNSDLMYAINDKSERAANMTRDTFKAMAKHSKRQLDMGPKPKDVNTVNAIIRGV